MKVSALPKKVWKKSSSYSKKYNNFSKKVVEARIRAFFGGFLVVVLLSLFLADSKIQQENDMVHFSSAPLTSASTSLLPRLQSVLGSSDTNLNNQITAQAAVVLDSDSQTVLYSKNADLRFSMASTTKIMTALTALSYYRPQDILTVKSAAQGSLVGFTVGEQLTFENMLYGLLLPSGNDAALAIAENYPGGQEAFVQKMNENARNYHLDNTQFADPAGLEDAGDFTTPLDLARLGSIAMHNSALAQIVATKEYEITDVTGKNAYHLHNLNFLLGVDGVNGIKTGTTDEAGQVLVTSKIEQGHTLILVVMRSLDRFTDTEKLLSLVSGNIQFVNLSSLQK